MVTQRYRTQAFLTGALMLAGAQAAQAATISIAPSAVDNPGIGETVTLFFKGSDFTEGKGGSVGGGINIGWDPSILGIDDLENDVTLLFPGDMFFGGGTEDAKGRLNNSTGVLENLSVASLVGTNEAEFDIASITFTAVSMGATGIDIELDVSPEGGDNIWADVDAATQVDPVFVDGAVTVKPAAVPVPAAAWFLASGIFGLAAVGRRTRRKGGLNTST